MTSWPRSRSWRAISGDRCSGLLGPAATFKRCYATPIERWRDQHATERLRRATGPFILRRLNTDGSIVSDLPEKIEMRVDCHLTKEQATLYQAVVDEMLEKAEHAVGIESFGVGSRLQRGRNYARRGQVVEREVEPGIVIAKVQGSRYTPYRVRIRVKPLSEQQWRRVEKAMAARALPLAQLLAGEMPHDIEDVFASCKLTLFPQSSSELKASCTCPDWENPCKHIAAACYILAERFDEDPFLIFAWRGRDNDEPLRRLRARRDAVGQRRSPDA